MCLANSIAGDCLLRLKQTVILCLNNTGIAPVHLEDSDWDWYSWLEFQDAMTEFDWELEHHHA